MATGKGFPLDLAHAQYVEARRPGKAPGQRFFEKETGIATSQWRGKLWVRWGDAVADAGLAPNTVAEKLDPDAVLDCYEEACRKYSRPPTYAEWRMFVGSDAERVGVNSLKRTFGSTEGAIIALRERAVKRGEGDLVAMLPEVEAPTVSLGSPSTSQAAALLFTQAPDLVHIN